MGLISVTLLDYSDRTLSPTCPVHSQLNLNKKRRCLLRFLQRSYPHTNTFTSETTQRDIILIIVSRMVTGRSVAPLMVTKFWNWIQYDEEKARSFGGPLLTSDNTGRGQMIHLPFDAFSGCALCCFLWNLVFPKRSSFVFHHPVLSIIETICSNFVCPWPGEVHSYNCLLRLREQQTVKREAAFSMSSCPCSFHPN